MKPLLAATIEDIAVLKFPLLASPKLDGVRALIFNKQLVSRNLKPIRNVYTQRLFCSLPEGFDGELIVGDPTSKTCFRDTSSGVMSADGEPDVKFYIFDNWMLQQWPYEGRVKMLKDFLTQYRPNDVKMVPQFKVTSMFAVDSYEDNMLEKGYEGIMLRSPKGIYKFGRSTLKEAHLMKLKKFCDSEAKILDVIELKHNENEKTKDELGRSKRSSHKAGKVAAGTMGALLVRDLKSGVEFQIGAGFTDEDRKLFWTGDDSIGSIIKYKYFPTGSKDKPRFPVFLGFRDKGDMS